MKMKFLLAVVALSSLLFICSGERILQENRTWCVASGTATAAQLSSNINYCCSQLKRKSCAQLIGPGAPCYEPNTLVSHASVVMNAFYVENGQHPWDCFFQGTGVVSVSDPSFGNCRYD